MVSSINSVTVGAMSMMCGSTEVVTAALTILQTFPPECDLLLKMVATFDTLNALITNLREGIHLSIDASIRPFLSNIAQSKIDGRSLFVIDDEFLQQIGISIFGVRHILLQAVGLLRHLCYGMKSENLQSLCLRIVISSRELSNTLKLADKCKIALNKLNVIAVLSTVLMSISRVIEDIKRLLGWLDRSPFDRLEKYIEFRSDIVGITLELSRSVCIPRKQLLFNFRQIKELCDRLIIKCESIICLSNDPSILYTAYLERVVLRKLNPSDDWVI
ncbi:unnamed protein product [Dracunculus medinensis]|uniref:CRIC domain-containing protein n=1 Tax=Dracunculus medinensis TaxID=318479 RepID=A0A0N4UNY1_DRAME|nr:unnamed protein product [Dracunculus medinensis]